MIELYGGGASLMGREPTEVQLVSEIVKIKIDSTKYYTVDATFNFFNHGKNEAKFLIEETDKRWAIGCKFVNKSSQNIRNYKFKRLGEYRFEYILNNFEPYEDEKVIIMTDTISLPSEELESYWLEETMYNMDKKDLELLPQKMLIMLKNTIYAKYGKIFDDSIIQEYFNGISWYKPSKDFQVSKLNELDRKNILLIDKYIQIIQKLKHKVNGK